jgi:hypothetical protein
MALAILCCGIAIVAWGMLGERDHFASAPLEGSADWFENYEGLVTRQMQDRDVFYHNIGHSIENARKADIIILGHSVLEFALVNNRSKSSSEGITYAFSIWSCLGLPVALSCEE